VIKKDRSSLWKAAAFALACGLGGCLTVKAAPLPSVAPDTCQTASDAKIGVLSWPDEPARHLPAHPSPDLAFKAAAATIRNLEAALRAQQALLNEHNAAVAAGGR
jgi:hypothetical protein